MRPETSFDPSYRKPGRSFEHPEKPLGYELLEQSTDSNLVHEDFRDRAEQGASHPNGVAERAKGVSVLRKFEELVCEENLPIDAAGDIHRALELACGRVGLTYPEYRALMDKDVELLELEARVLEDARRLKSACK